MSIPTRPLTPSFSVAAQLSPADMAHAAALGFKTIINNVNAFSLYANPDQCGDETSFGHQSFGEPGAGLIFYVRNKPTITKGMQTVIVSDVDWIRPRAYLHRHKLHTKLFNTQGPNEVTSG